MIPEQNLEEAGLLDAQDEDTRTWREKYLADYPSNPLAYKLWKQFREEVRRCESFLPQYIMIYEPDGCVSVDIRADDDKHRPATDEEARNVTIDVRTDLFADISENPLREISNAVESFAWQLLEAVNAMRNARPDEWGDQHDDDDDDDDDDPDPTQPFVDSPTGLVAV